MNATTTNRTEFAGLTPATVTATPGDYIRQAQNSFLTELPGLAFGLITLAYIAMSLLGLA